MWRVKRKITEQQETLTQHANRSTKRAVQQYTPRKFRIGKPTWASLEMPLPNDTRSYVQQTFCCEYSHVKQQQQAERQQQP